LAHASNTDSQWIVDPENTMKNRVGRHRRGAPILRCHYSSVVKFVSDPCIT
jgi:hypothetical protein